MNFILFYLISFALVILNIEVLSLFKMIGFFPVLILTLIEIPLILKLKISFSGLQIKEVFKKDKWLIFLIFSLIFSLCVSLFLCFVSPPNEADASSYHCLRALFWAKDGFISHFNISDIRAHCFPINSEIVYTYLLTLFKTDSIFPVLSFVSYVALVVSSYKIMEIFEIDFIKRIWAIVIFSSFAGVIVQISSTQTDIITSALLSISVYFVLKYKNKPDTVFLFLSSLSAAISFGVKTTALIAFLPLIIYYICLLKDKKSDILKFFLFLGLNFIVFSSYNYILNIIDYNNPFGAEPFLNEHKICFDNIQTFFIAGFSNLIKYTFHIFDFSALAGFYFLSPVYDFCFNFIFNLLHINPYFNSNGEIPSLNIGLFEQTTGFGVLGILVLLPSIIFSFKTKLRVFSLLFLSQVLILSFSTIYFPTSIRFFITFSFLLIPLLSLMYKKGYYIIFVNLVAVFYLIYTPINLPQRPFFNILKELNGGYKNAVDNIRNLNYGFYNVTKKQSFLAYELKKYCKGKKIALFLNNGFMTYPIKYYDFKGEYSVQFLNIFNHDDLSEFDFLVYEADKQQSTAFINHFETPLCKGSYLNKKQIGITCYLDEISFSMFEFLPFVELHYQADELLKKLKTDEDSEFHLLKKNVTNY